MVRAFPQLASANPSLTSEFYGNYAGRPAGGLGGRVSAREVQLFVILEP